MQNRTNASSADAALDLARFSQYFSERSPQPMLTVEGPSHIVRHVNSAFLRLAGSDRLDVIGRPFAMAARQAAGRDALLDRVYQSGTPESMTEQKNAEASSVYWSYLVWAIDQGDDGTPGLMVQVTDATEGVVFRAQAVAMNEALLTSALRQDELTQVAEELNARLQETLQEKSHFIAVLSHELRTPLTPVILAASLLQQDPRLAPDMHPMVEMIQRNIAQEARLIDDLLDMTRMERGKLNLERRPVDVRELLQRSLALVVTEIDAARLTLACDIGDEQLIIDGDAGRLQQVFSNLLRNAIKYTPPGGQLTIACSRDGDSCRVAFTDSGIGMDAAFLPHAFDPFEQGTRGKTSREGLGLGLSICKSIVDLHGGAITAQSLGQDRGSTFVIALPILPDAAPRTPAEDRPASKSLQSVPSLRILLVEDHDDTARMLRRMLMTNGHNVQWASDIAIGLQLAETHEFDLLLSDLGLPDGTGLDLMRALRQRGFKLPGIVLSGYGQVQDIARSYEAGFAAHLIKPMNLKKLTDTMLTVVG